MQVNERRRTISRHFKQIDKKSDRRNCKANTLLKRKRLEKVAFDLYWFLAIQERSHSIF